MEGEEKDNKQHSEGKCVWQAVALLRQARSSVGKIAQTGTAESELPAKDPVRESHHLADKTNKPKTGTLGSDLRANDRSYGAKRVQSSIHNRKRLGQSGSQGDPLCATAAIHKRPQDLSHTECRKQPL